MRPFFLYIFLFFALTAAANCQNVNVTSSLDTNRIYLGDQIKFTITVDKPSNLGLTLPLFKDTIIKKIDILSGPVIDSVRGKDGRTKIFEKYLITSFESGTYQIPPVYVELKGVTGLKRYFSDYAGLEVMKLSIPPADTTAKIYDIIKPYRAPVTIGEIVPWVLVAAILGALTWAIIRYIKKHKKVKISEEEVVNPDPAHVIAFRELEKLRNEELWQKGEIKNYYTRLTEVLRQYLENRYRVYSLELTTAETLDALVKTGFKKNGSYNQIKSVLTGADLVKFAKYKPEAAENETHFHSSWDFIEATKETELISAEPVSKSIEEEGGR